MTSQPAATTDIASTDAETGRAHSGRRLPIAWRRTFGNLTLTYLPDAGMEVLPTVFLSTTTDAH